MQELKIKRVREAAILPARATEGSAGYDLCACLEEALLLPAHGRVVVPTGIAVELAPGVAGFVFGRSGLGVRHGIAPSNAVGVIDADYRGEILVGLQNGGDEDYLIRPGERIAQLVLMPVRTPPVLEVQELGETARGAGGFGSTGRQGQEAAC